MKTCDTNVTTTQILIMRMVVDPGAARQRGAQLKTKTRHQDDYTLKHTSGHANNTYI